MAFLAYCLLVTLKNRLQVLAPGLTPKAVLEKLATIQMLDVWFPTTDGRWLVMPRFTQLEADQAILLHKLKLELPQKPRPRIKTQVPEFPQSSLLVVPTSSIGLLKANELGCPLCLNCERQAKAWSMVRHFVSAAYRLRTTLLPIMSEICIILLTGGQ